MQQVSSSPIHGRQLGEKEGFAVVFLVLLHCCSWAFDLRL